MGQENRSKKETARGDKRTSFYPGPRCNEGIMINQGLGGVKEDECVMVKERRGYRIKGLCSASPLPFNSSV